MNFYIADLHFEHENIIENDSRPFSSVDAMNNVLIENWNSRVSEDDSVYVLGDAFLGKEARCIEIMKRLRGHKHLIKGNHDKVNGRLSTYWESIKDYDEIRDNNRLVVLCHYPMMFYKEQNFGAVMLHGHVHRNSRYEFVGIWQEQMRASGLASNIMNVGCMMDYMNYTPRTLDEVCLYQQLSSR